MKSENMARTWHERGFERAGSVSDGTAYRKNRRRIEGNTVDRFDVSEDSSVTVGSLFATLSVACASGSSGCRSLHAGGCLARFLVAIFANRSVAYASGSSGCLCPRAERSLAPFLIFLVSLFASKSNQVVAQNTSPPHPDGILAREDPVVEPVGLSDWPVLDRALKRPKPASGRIVSFRELWSARPSLADEPVIIAGVVYRRFRSEPRGQFPSLEELWIRTDDDGLAVVTNVVPPKTAKPERDLTEPGSPVRLISYFLRKIRYEAEDEPRIAPWLVAKGFEDESAETVSGASKAFEESGDSIVLFVILAVIAAVTLLRLMIFWAERTRRRSEAVREAMRERARARTESANATGEPNPREGGGP